MWLARLPLCSPHAFSCILRLGENERRE
jgi:hypothetical protein